MCTPPSWPFRLAKVICPLEGIAGKMGAIGPCESGLVVVSVVYSGIMFG